MRSHRLHRLIGYLVIVIILFFTTKAPRAQRNDTDAEIVIVKAQQITRINPYQEEYEKLLYPTVRISSPSGVGSGVVISYTQIYILTAAHVVGEESTVTIEFFSPSVFQSASVVITDTAKDLALIKIRSVPPSLHVYSATLAPENYQPYLFNPIYTIGCSLGLPPRPSAGIISVVESDHWEVTSPILPGNSGGPVYDARTYEVIGIAVWVKLYNGQLITTMGGIVPINAIYALIRSAGVVSERHGATEGARQDADSPPAGDK